MGLWSDATSTHLSGFTCKRIVPSTLVIILKDKWDEIPPGHIAVHAAEPAAAGPAGGSALPRASRSPAPAVTPALNSIPLRCPLFEKATYAFCCDAVFAFIIKSFIT